MKRIFLLSAVFAGVLVLNALAMAHVPYFEHRDYTSERPFVVRYGIEQSIAVYAWLTTDWFNPSTDVDVYQFEVIDPVRVYLEVLVPVCPEYEEFAPWFALVGPGLPEPYESVPFDLPPGYGALVFPNIVTGDPRETFYEPFGGKSYYKGPVFDEVIDIAGTYYVVFWDLARLGGDYVAVLGAEEIWRPRDVIRALFYTPLIRRGEELHTDCVQE